MLEVQQSGIYLAGNLVAANREPSAQASEQQPSAQPPAFEQRPSLSGEWNSTALVNGFSAGLAGL